MANWHQSHPLRGLLPKTMTEESEFGRGYATCLRQFLNHTNRLTEWLNANVFGSEEMAVDVWFNASSDHLYDLVRPQISDMEWDRASKLRHRALTLGHGFVDHGTADEAYAMLREALDLLSLLEMPTQTLEEAMATDRLLGIEPESGSWSCPLDVVRSL